ncbi:MAG: serine/threonine-protein kinase [Mycobacterium sp.]
MPLADGQVVAGYTILRTLGSGGMGDVYLAQHPRLPRRDALKVLGNSVSHDDEYRQRFTLEAETVATLRHPHIVTIYDRGESDGRLWIAMEFVDGIDAARLLHQHPEGLPPAEVIRIVAAVADALDYAHSRQLLHRDIKPANILLGQRQTGDDRIMLVDFGVARHIDRVSNLTGADMTIGTVSYAAPEQLKGEQIDGRADQYALAATAYHLLTGAAPYAYTNPTVVISHHLSSEPPDIAAQRPDLARFGPVFTKAMAKDPADRFERCRDFALSMLRAAGAEHGAAPRHRMPQRGSRRLRWAAAAAGALLVAGAATAAVLLSSHHRGGRDSVPPVAPSLPPPAVASRMDLPVVLIGADCAVLGAAAVDQTGAPAYCARSDGPGSTTVWSTQPDRLRGAS